MLFLEEAKKRRLTREEVKKWALFEKISWIQKSGVWLKKGGMNTRFFHKMANSHRRRNYMKKIKINGILLEEETAMQRSVVDEFQRLLSDPGG